MVLKMFEYDLDFGDSNTGLDFNISDFNLADLDIDTVEDDSSSLDDYLKWGSDIVDFIGDVVDVGHDLGILEDDTNTIMKDNETSVSDWLNDNFGGVIQSQTTQAIMPWILGLGVLGLILYAVNRR